MGDMECLKKTGVRKRVGKIHTGKPKHRRQDNIKIGCKDVNCNLWL
jgi:hypothetical protein